MPCCALLTACPGRAGIQEGRGTQSVHQENAAERATVAVVERLDTLPRGFQVQASFGDWCLSNKHAQFCVSQLGISARHPGSGGTLLDATHRQGQDVLGGVDTGLAISDQPWTPVFYTEASMSAATETRASLTLRGLSQAHGDLGVETRYELEADGSTLLVKSTFANQGTATISLRPGDRWRSAEAGQIGAQWALHGGSAWSSDTPVRFAQREADTTAWRAQSQEVRPGEALTWVRRWIVAPDRASLSSQLQAPLEPEPAQGTLLLQSTRPVRWMWRARGVEEAPLWQVAAMPEEPTRIQVPVGEYEVFASAGPTHTLAQATVKVEQGQAESVTLTPQRVFETPGWRAADLHQGLYVPHQAAAAWPQVATNNLAEGIEIFSITEPGVFMDPGEALADFAPASELEAWSSFTVSAPQQGHFAVYGWGGGAGPTGGLLLSEQEQGIDTLRRLREAAGSGGLVQVLQPLHDVDGYWDSLRTSERPEAWSFHTMEIMTGTDWRHAPEAIQAWFSSLKRGNVFLPLGGSGALHQVQASLGAMPPGSVRTWMKVPPGADSLQRSLASSRALQVSTGPFLTLRLDGQEIGSVTQAKAMVILGGPPPDASSQLEVKVEAAPWVEVSQVEVLLNGEVVQSWTVDPALDTAVRFEETVELAFDSAGWLVVRAYGEGSMAPVVPDPIRPMAISAPFWVKR